MKITVKSLLKLHNIHSLIEKVNKKLDNEEILRTRFYEKITGEDKAEFINGEPVFHSPDVIEHTEVGMRLLHILAQHVSLHSLGMVGYEKVMLHFKRNSYQPDLCFFTAAQRKTFTVGQMLYPPPVFVVEILSHSTEKKDRTTKFRDYAFHGVTEYWMINHWENVVEQYVLNNITKQYDLLEKHRNSLIKSVAVDGFEVHSSCLFDAQKYEEFFKKEEEKRTLLQRRVKAKDSEIKEKNSLLQEKDSLLQEKDSLLQEKDSEIAEVKSALQEKDSLLQEKDSEIAEVKSALQEKDSEIEEVKSLLQEKDSEIEEVKSLLQEQELKIQKINSVLQEKDSEILKIDSVLQNPNLSFQEKKHLLQKKNELLSEKNQFFQQLLFELSKK